MIQKGKEHLVHRQFTLPEGYSVKSFTLREIDGHDEKESARMLAALGTADDFSMAMLEANLRVSIVSVDGSPVQQPYNATAKWSSKTRRLLMEAWGTLNSVPDDDLATFLGAAASPTAANMEVGQEINEEDLESSKID